jgi:hypothetical protein
MQVHPSQISPGENYDVFYFIRNHTDATTYYVQAKVYDVKTGDLLDTFALTQSATNARLFIKTVQAPGDPVGQGRNIVAIATVYTDSGYTTKSSDYEEQEQYYLVKDIQRVFGGGGTDYRLVREIVQEEVKKGLEGLPKPPEFKVPDAPDMSFVDALFGTLGALTREINRIPKEAADLQPLTDQITELSKMVAARPQFERTDLSALTEAAQTVETQLRDVREDLASAPAELIRAIDGALRNIEKQLTATLTTTIDQGIQSKEFSFHVQPPKPEAQPQDPTAAIRHLMTA